jgi:hypothetical protein
MVSESIPAISSLFGLNLGPGGVSSDLRVTTPVPGEFLEPLSPKEFGILVLEGVELIGKDLRLLSGLEGAVEKGDVERVTLTREGVWLAESERHI